MKTPREVAHDGMMYDCPALGHFRECDRMMATIVARDAEHAASSSVAWEALELLQENKNTWAAVEVDEGTGDYGNGDPTGDTWLMCPHCGGTAFTCDEVGDCWGAKARKLISRAALALRPRGTP